MESTRHVPEQQEQETSSISSCRDLRVLDADVILERSVPYASFSPFPTHCFTPLARGSSRRPPGPQKINRFDFAMNLKLGRQWRAKLCLTEVGRGACLIRRMRTINNNSCDSEQSLTVTK